MFGHERSALAVIASLTGAMGFVESMAAVPAGSVTLAADGLAFVQHSISAFFAFWAASGNIERERWTVQAQGIVMAALGIGVFAVAVHHFYFGSIPHPLIMIAIGAMALGTNLTVGAIMLSQRRQPMNFQALWRLTKMDAVGNVAVMAAGLSVAFTRSNIPDLVIGAVMAALFLSSGWRTAVSGRLDTGRTP